MKKVTQYKCEICGTLYSEETVCTECESQHKIPVSIVKAHHRAKGIKPKYPQFITIKFNDESEREYRILE